MSFTRLLVVLCLIGVVVISFFPWISLPSRGIVATGMEAESLNFGKPALVNLFFTGLFLLLVLLNKLWSLRTAFFIGACNFSWALRNYFAMSACSGGICPEKHAALYLLVILTLAAVILLLFVSKENRSFPAETAAP